MYGLCTLKQGKLEARAKRCVFIGYPRGVKGYKLWCLEPGEQKCIISRDLVFDKSKMGYQSQSHKFYSENTYKQDATQVEVESGESSGQETDSKKDEFDDQIVDEQITELYSYACKKEEKGNSTSIFEIWSCRPHIICF